MKAEYAMTRNIVCVRPDDTVADALELMQEWCIRHLPVVDDEELVGILSDRDLIRVEADGVVEDCMTRKPIVCKTTTSLVEVAEIMLDEKIDSIPVVDSDGELAGLITSSDFLQFVVDRERRALTHPIPFRFEIHQSVRPGMRATLVPDSP